MNVLVVLPGVAMQPQHAFLSLYLELSRQRGSNLRGRGTNLRAATYLAAVTRQPNTKVTSEINVGFG